MTGVVGHGLAVLNPLTTRLTHIPSGLPRQLTVLVVALIRSVVLTHIVSALHPQLTVLVVALIRAVSLISHQGALLHQLTVFVVGLTGF